eukprot:NODE_5672_length_495_cov_30.204036_g4239_i0.p1 GENE.NODE_5672_length_495_cov_30.204036_g4239_i0~~NODE_5672_length_495_cov_30.204036_g4239_i0.p1  ORF type:complete len:84 (+),score=13.79 NODE_5672_length_495_cov_30.204036_g4239_i0:148-399(+)
MVARLRESTGASMVLYGCINSPLFFFVLFVFFPSNYLYVFFFVFFFAGDGIAVGDGVGTFFSILGFFHVTEVLLSRVRVCDLP